jgi:hypothetical protein
MLAEQELSPYLRFNAGMEFHIDPPLGPKTSGPARAAY